MMNPVELISMLAIRKRPSLMRWLWDDETGTPDLSRVAIVVGMMVGLVVLKRVVKHLKNRDDE